VLKETRCQPRIARQQISLKLWLPPTRLHNRKTTTWKFSAVKISYKHCFHRERKFVCLQLAKHWGTLTVAAPASHVVGSCFQLATDVQKYLNKAMICSLHPLVVSSYKINGFKLNALFSVSSSKQNSPSSSLHDVSTASGCVHHIHTAVTE
jgi:hypothetical protein